MTVLQDHDRAFLSEGAGARTILQARDPFVLQRIGAPGVAAAIWQRERSARLTEWVASLPLSRLPVMRGSATVGEVEPAIHAACDRAGTPRDGMRDILASDIAALALIMAGVTGEPRLHLRLDAVSTDSCRRFHVDHMTARMLCTYRGVGTQLAQPGQEQAPHEIATGAVAILRGALWPGRETTALLHRSPSIMGADQTRLLLVIDPASDHRPQGKVH